jgi:hypothetical protein
LTVLPKCIGMTRNDEGRPRILLPKHEGTSTEIPRAERKLFYRSFATTHCRDCSEDSDALSVLEDRTSQPRPVTDISKTRKDFATKENGCYAGLQVCLRRVLDTPGPFQTGILHFAFSVGPEIAQVWTIRHHSRASDEFL